MMQDSDAGREPGASEYDAARPVIVVGLDGSRSSWDAFCWAVGEAGRRNGRVVAVYVVPLTDAGTAFGAPFDYNGIEQANHDVADEVKREAFRRADELDVALSFVAERGDVTRALTATARRLRANLVVVGRSAKILHRLAGSLSHRLTSRNDAPVVVVVP